ncbi:hypothetical protein LCGC14_1573100 [marine sediment metagenome]|uniref:Uncharacterized protein n=1 Tax=marine sediment metagenome TaxID=412755 RepID=A0A0F9J5D8_9ZZZZ
MSVGKLLEGMQIPLFPELGDKDSLEKWIRDIHEYLRRLAGVFTGDNIINSIVNEGDVTQIVTLVKFVDIQTSAFDADDLIVFSELVTNTGAYKLFIDISAMTGYSASAYQWMIHNDDAGIKFEGSADWGGYDSAQVEFLSHNSSGDPIWVDLTSADISGYVAGNQQVLTHNTSGVLVWVDTAVC